MTKKNKKSASILFVASLLLILVICAMSYTNFGEGKATVPVDQKISQQEKTPKVVQTMRDSEESDPLLMLVNDDNAIPAEYRITPRLYSNIMVDIRIYDDLVRLIDDASKKGVILWVASGYRTVEVQEKLYKTAVDNNIESGMTDKQAKTVASQTIALPQYSEHHTGLVVDFNTVSESFKDTPEYKWLEKHAEEYGFVQRYRAEKEDITNIHEEVWHYRYVGVEHAKRMNQLKMCLEEYCEYLQEENLT